MGEQGSQSEEASSVSCLDPFDLGATYFQIPAILSLFTAIQAKHDEARLGSVESHSIVWRNEMDYGSHYKRNTT